MATLPRRHFLTLQLLLLQQALPGFRGERGQLGGWRFRIARHDLDDDRRRAARAHQ